MERLGSLGVAVPADALPPAIGIRRIDHVQLAMPGGREDDAAAFYQGLLGLTRVPKPDALAARGGCWSETGDVHVHLASIPSSAPPPRPIPPCSSAACPPSPTASGPPGSP